MNPVVRVPLNSPIPLYRLAIEKIQTIFEMVYQYKMFLDMKSGSGKDLIDSRLKKITEPAKAIAKQVNSFVSGGPNAPDCDDVLNMVESIYCHSSKSNL